jgi:hypothetical protein
MASVLVTDSEETCGHVITATGEFDRAIGLLHNSAPDVVLPDVVLIDAGLHGIPVMGRVD